MLALFAFVAGLAIGSGAVLALVFERHGRLRRELTALETERATLQRQIREVAEQQRALSRAEHNLKTQAVSYEELRKENAILKQDLRNIDVQLRKLELDREAQARRQAQLDAEVRALGERYLTDHVKWIGSTITPNNYATRKSQLLKVIQRCREIGFEVPEAQETQLLADLKALYEKAVRLQIQREEQARIRAQIREEQRLEREIQRELERVEREKRAIEEALQRALREAHDEQSREIELLRARLAEVEARRQRAISRAQLTKAGHVYVISNVGSFGEGVFKIGMTRRLEPNDRVRELGDASVPFPFDVHMMISCDDAPALENALHRELHRCRLNKVNPRKEFFRVDLDTIRQIVEKHHGEVEYVTEPEALEYRQSLEMTDEDARFIEEVYERIEDEEGVEEID